MTETPLGRQHGSVKNIILIGYRGSGKTSVAAELARRLGWPRVDTDRMIEEASGRTISDIFARDGEPAFRMFEHGAIAEALRKTRRVISVGGGAVTFAENRASLKAAGVCVWLTAPAEVLHQRLTADLRSPAQRPALTQRSGLEEIEQVLAERSALYAEVADHTVDTTEDTITVVADTILARLRGGA